MGEQTIRELDEWETGKKEEKEEPAGENSGRYWGGEGGLSEQQAVHNVD